MNIKKWQIFASIFCLILGTILHFTYEWFNYNVIVGLFSTINESVWEHLKLLFYPMFFISIIGYFKIGRKLCNYWYAQMYGIGFALIFEKSNKSRGALIQAIYRSNFVLMGLPIVGNIFGSGRLGMTSMLVTVIVPMYNILAVITLEVFRGESIKITKILKGIVTNPLIIGSVAGILFAAFGIKLPEIAESVISDMASAATPLALIVLGASFEFASIKRYKKNLIAVIFARLIIVPAISLSVAIMIGFRGIDLVSLIGIFASPCAVSSYTMARQMDSDYELSAGTVVFTTMLSCFTLFGWIYFLKELNFF